MNIFKRLGRAISGRSNKADSVESLAESVELPEDDLEQDWVGDQLLDVDADLAAAADDHDVDSEEWQPTPVKESWTRAAIDKLRQFAAPESEGFSDPTRDISGEVLLSFPFVKGGPLKREASLTMDRAKTSIMVFGATGEGKTRSVGVPLLYRLHELRCPGLVLDIVKSDYANICRRFPNVIIVGPVPDARPINLIHGWSVNKFKDFLTKGVQSLSTGNGENFWGSEGVTDAILIFEFISEALKRKPTLADVYDYLNNAARFVEDFKAHSDAVRDTDEIDSPILTKLRQRQRGSYRFSILQAGERKHSERTEEQFAWHTAKLLTLLRPFADNELIREKLCNAEAGALSMSDLIYEHGRIVVLDMPYSYGEACTTVGQLLRIEFRDSIIGAKELRKQLGYGKTRYTFTLLDEYQRYATGLGGAMGSADETNWTDISREFGNINIYLTQSVSSLVAASGAPRSVDTVVQNCRNIICLPTIDEATLSLAATLSQGDPEVRRELVQLQERRTGFIYFARAGATGRSAIGQCLLSGSRHKFMDSQLADALLEQPPIPSKLHSAKLVLVSLLKAHRGEGPRVVVITTATKHHGYTDFATRLKFYGCDVDLTIEMPPIGDPQFRLTHALDTYSRQAEAGDILAIVRGGGDRATMTMFDEETSVERLERLRNLGVHVVVGVGHTKDTFAIERVATHVATVPFHAAEIVAKVLTGTRLWNEARSKTCLERIANSTEDQPFTALETAGGAGGYLATLDPQEIVREVHGIKSKEYRDAAIESWADYIDHAIEEGLHPESELSAFLEALYAEPEEPSPPAAAPENTWVHPDGSVRERETDPAKLTSMRISFVRGVLKIGEDGDLVGSKHREPTAPTAVASDLDSAPPAKQPPAKKVMKLTPRQVRNRRVKLNEIDKALKALMKECGFKSEMELREHLQGVARSATDDGAAPIAGVDQAERTTSTEPIEEYPDRPRPPPASAESVLTLLEQLVDDYQSRSELVEGEERES